MKFVIVLILIISTAFASMRLKRQSADPVPGLMSGFGRGYDVVQERIRAPLVLFTYEYKQTWLSPYDGKTYMFPDQSYLTNIGRGTTDDVISLFNSWETFYSQKTSSMGVNAGLGIGSNGGQVSLAFNRSKNEINGYLKNKTRNIALDNRIMSLYQLDLWPLSDNYVAPLQRALAALPRTLKSDSDKRAYQNLINGWGTHYITSAQFGSKVNITTVFDQSLINQYGSKWVTTQIGLSFSWEKIKAGIDSGSTKNTSKVDETFAQKSQNFVDYSGGTPATYATDGYKAWLATVPANPAIVYEKNNHHPTPRIVK